jgi:hypothetical protein
MFGLFKKKKVKDDLPPQLFDLHNEPLREGDMVKALRYDLGQCKLVLEGLHYYYQSTDSEQKISYTKMVDAITKNQKVEKI